MAPPTGSGNASLPHLRTSLVGREADIERATAALLGTATPLLTLTGPGGVGKTRLAVAIADAVAETFAQGVAFVDLSPLRSQDEVMPEIAGVLGVQFPAHRAPGVALRAALASRQMLLLLDNLEQVADAAPAIAELLAGCPALQILATSRVPMNIRVEHLQPVLPLALPKSAHADIGALTANDAMALFVERARAADPGFNLTADNAAAVVAICRRLDGLPLALELAAARIRTMSAQALLDLLSNRLDALGEGARDAPDRQRSLRATIAWSHDLLQADDQRVFRLLAAIPGGFGLATAAAVIELDVPSATRHLATLVDHNLLLRRVGHAGEDRYAMLDTVRAYATSQLDASGEANDTARRLARWCLEFAEQAAHELEGPSPAGWMDRMTEELASVRASLEWTLANREFETGVRLSTAMRGFRLAGGGFREGHLLHQHLLAAACDLPPAVEARACIAASDLPRSMGDFASAGTYADRAEALARATRAPGLLCEALTVHTDLSANSGRSADAWRDADEAIACCRRAGDARAIGWNLHAMAMLAAREAHYGKALSLFDDALACFGEAQHVLGHSWCLTGSAFALIEAGNLEDASIRLGDALRMHLANTGITGIAICFGGLAWLAVRGGSPGVAARLCGAINVLSHDTGWALTAHDFEERDRAMRDARTQLGEDNFTREWAAGVALSLQDAIDLALSVSERAVMATSSPPRLGASGASGPALSRREQEVLDLLCEHWTAPEIAEQLYVSPRTVESHIAHIYTKLGVTNRRDALAAVAHKAPAAPAESRTAGRNP